MTNPNQSRSLHTASLLANVQQELEILFTSTSESILLIELNGIILMGNLASANWLQMRVDLLPGENLFQLLTSFGVPIREWVHEAVSKKTIYNGNASLGDHFMNIRLIPITGDDKVMRLIVIGQDITEQRRAEEQVRELAGQLERKVRERTEELEKLNQKLTQDRQHAELLANLSQRLIEEAQDYQGLLKYITQELSELIGDACLIALFTSDRAFIEILAFTDRDPDGLDLKPEQLIHQTVPVDTSPIFSSILNGKRYSAKEISPESRADIFPSLLKVNFGERNLSDLEVYPLQTSDQPLGVLAIVRKHGQPYSDDEISFIGNLISPISLTIQNARLVEKLTESQTQLRGLSQQLVQVQENQYSHLAKELHDRIGQDMTAININLNIIRETMPKTMPENITSRLDDIETLVQESVQRMRSIMADFRPPMLDAYGLIAALNWYGEQFSRRANISVNINDRYFKEIRLPGEIEIALFRIVQEALTNVAKHAQASKVDIELLENNDSILMTITDNGVGFATQMQGISSEGHWGLTNMRERARAINGQFLLRSVPGQGTQILVKVGRES